MRTRLDKKIIKLKHIAKYNGRSKQGSNEFYVATE